MIGTSSGIDSATLRSMSTSVSFQEALRNHVQRIDDACRNLLDTYGAGAEIRDELNSLGAGVVELGELLEIHFQSLENQESIRNSVHGIERLCDSVELEDARRVVQVDMETYIREITDAAATLVMGSRFVNFAGKIMWGVRKLVRQVEMMGEALEEVAQNITDKLGLEDLENELWPEEAEEVDVSSAESAETLTVKAGLSEDSSAGLIHSPPTERD